MPIKKCWHGRVTPEPAGPVGPRMPGAQYGLTLQYIYLGCGEEVGDSVVLHSAMATAAETDAYGYHRSRVAVTTAGSAESLPVVGQPRAPRPRQMPGGWWGRASPGQGCGHRRAISRDTAGEVKCIAAVFAGGCSLSRHVALFLEPGSSRDKTFPSQQCEHLRKGKKPHHPPI